MIDFFLSSQWVSSLGRPRVLLFHMEKSDLGVFSCSKNWVPIGLVQIPESFCTLIGHSLPKQFGV